jgi:hypothetical protein
MFYWSLFQAEHQAFSFTNIIRCNNYIDFLENESEFQRKKRVGSAFSLAESGLFSRNTMSTVIDSPQDDAYIIPTNEKLARSDKIGKMTLDPGIDDGMYILPGELSNSKNNIRDTNNTYSALLDFSKNIYVESTLKDTDKTDTSYLDPNQIYTETGESYNNGVYAILEEENKIEK